MTSSRLNLLLATAAVLCLGLAALSFALPAHARHDRLLHPPQNKNAKSTAEDESKPLTAPLDVKVQTAPWAFKGNGKWHLVYELHIANIGQPKCTLTKIEVAADSPARRTLAAFAGKELNALISHPDGEDRAPATIPGAGVVIAYMWVTVDRQEDVPATFSHRITLRVDGYSQELAISTPDVTVNRSPVPVIGAPLRGGDWGAAHGPGNDNHHRRGLLTINGHSYIGERFAIDWLRITASGDIHTGDAGNNKNYPGYGAEVLAVADGSITAKLDGIAENTPGTEDAGPFTLETICGNYVTLRFGKFYASYCHLQPGSIRVKVGDKVKRGQVLALVGNSGSSSAPHLHFQVCDADSRFTCEGVPYALRSFVQEFRSFNSPGGKPQPDIVHTMEIPTYEMLVRFVE